MLEELSFGGLAAEEERHLAQYFLETPEFRSVARGGKTLVLGEKGSGKTAIARYLSIRPSSSPRPTVTVDLSPDLYLWTSVSRWMEEGVPPSAARKLAWKLTLIQYLGHYLLANSLHAGPLSDGLQAIRAFLYESDLYIGDPK
ncbi:MAG: ORC-CDC6 family AAA ATPase [Methanobacteriota archaeon]